MDFLGVGVAELIFIFIIALMVLGPRRLPGYAAKAGKMVRDLRNMSQGLMIEWQRELAVATRIEELEETRRELQEAQKLLRDTQQTIASETKQVAKETSQVVTETSQAISAKPKPANKTSPASDLEQKSPPSETTAAVSIESEPPPPTQISPAPQPGDDKKKSTNGSGKTETTAELSSAEAINE
jgi:sec-independent protein translocase protein TatB